MPKQTWLLALLSLAPTSVAAQLGANDIDKAALDPRSVAGASADTCGAATPETSLGLKSGTTVGQVDNYDLPTDESAPTCTASTSCTVGGIGRGFSYDGTGTGPDRVYRIETDRDCTLTITAVPTNSQDLSLVVYQGKCSNQLSDCVCVSDEAGGSQAEIVSLHARTGVNYFVVVDGYGGTAGPFELTISESTATGCTLTSINQLDVDGNGLFEPLADGLLILRYGFGFRGATLTSGATGQSCTRCTAEEIEAYLDSF